ncbi:MAG TPA: hypothetical protein VK665_09830 [Candidatus Elarobacter sp.]|nr:hypothetical protein [Candidatus Elarobacter sp.]
MAWCTDLDVKYHSQDQRCFCGPAVVQMVMAYLGVPIQELDQEEIFGMILAADPCWNGGGIPGSSPAGIVAALEYYRQVWLPDPRPPFAATPLATTSEVVGRVANALTAPNAAPPIVLMGGCDHWEVVTGFRSDDDPGADGAGILGFCINSPTLASSPPAPPPPPHTDDDLCGTTTEYGKPPEYGTPPEYVSVQEFVNALVPCLKAPDGRFIVVGDGSLQSSRPLRASPRALYGGRSALRSLWSAGGGDRDEQLAEAALAGFAAHDLVGGGDSFFSERPAGIADPVLVKRLDRFDSYYILAAVVGDGGRRIGHTRIDMRSAQLLGATAAEVSSVGTGLTEIFIEDVFVSSRWNCAQPMEPVRPGTYTVHPTLVWQPCLESPSPYQPFRQINVPGGVLYQAVNGTIFRSLTPFSRCNGCS